MTLAGAITQLQVISLACSGMKAAPATLPDNMSAYPFTICYPGSGELNCEGYDATRAIHNLTLDFHAGPITMRGLSMNTGIPILEELHRRIALDPTLGGNVSTLVFPIVYQASEFDWGQQKSVGFRLTIPVKIRGIAST